MIQSLVLLRGIFCFQVVVGHLLLIPNFPFTIETFSVIDDPHRNMSVESFLLKFIAGNFPLAFFFVLSGYLLTGSVLGNFRALNSLNFFLIKRINRLVTPLFFSFILLVILGLLANLLPSDFSLWSSYALNWRDQALAPEDFFRGIFLIDISSNPPLWSLRLQFIFVIVHILLFRFNLVSKEKVLLGLFSLLSIIYWFSFPTMPWIDAVNSWLFGFMVGVLVKVFKSQILKVSHIFLNLCMLIFFILYSYLIIEKSLYKLQNFCLILFCSLMILQIEKSKSFSKFNDTILGRILRIFGVYSYEIYLVHFPILLFVVSKLGFFQIYFHSVSGQILLTSAYIFSSFTLIAAASFILQKLTEAWLRYSHLAKKI